MGILRTANVRTVQFVALLTIVCGAAVASSMGLLSAAIISLSGILLWALAGTPRAGGVRRFSAGMIYFVLLIMGLGAGA